MIEGKEHDRTVDVWYVDVCCVSNIHINTHTLHTDFELNLWAIAHARTHVKSHRYFACERLIDVNKTPLLGVQ